MDDEIMNLHPYEILQYTNFLEQQCGKIKALCDAMQADLTLAYHAADELSGKEAALAIQRNINEISRNMPIYTALYNRLLLVRKKIIEAGLIIGNGGGNHAGI